jgi:hypothetical protein
VILLSNIIHQIFADNIEDYIAAKKPSQRVLKVLNHIVSCRTPALGAAVYDCDCGERLFVYHSCRDRHCPVCQNINNARWADKQLASALPVKYFHIVFTLPDIIKPIALSNPRQTYKALFKAASAALLKLCADKKHLGAIPGFTAVLHTWGQTMQFHPHLHVIITAGGLSKDGLRFVDKSDSGYLLPVKALSKLFRGAFIGALEKTRPISFELKRSLYQKDFFCYLKAPLERVDNVVKYLARYANRVCIAASRIVFYDPVGKTVMFSYKDNRDGGKTKHMTLSAVEFIRRFLLHVLPTRFMKIRHYGILKNFGKAERLQKCRRLLNCLVRFAMLANGPFVSLCKTCGSSLRLVGHFDALTLRRLLIC